MDQLLMDSPIGRLMVEGDENVVTSLRLPGRFESPDRPSASHAAAVREMGWQVAEYFRGERRGVRRSVAA